ncbi:hypothetical protein Pelo_1851 [Pelomyxa schiedti]|nr:hypothetical protein Pelo_1851 [Pelomyxa schiedti]
MMQKKKPAQPTPAASPSPSPSPSPAPSSSSPHTQCQQGQQQQQPVAAEVTAPAAPATNTSASTPAAAALQGHVARARASTPPCGAGAPTCTGTSTKPAAATESCNPSLLQDKLNDDATTRKEEALCTKPPPLMGSGENNRGRKGERGRIRRSRSRSRSRSWSRSKSRCRCRCRSRSSQSCRTSDSQELASDDESLEKYIKNSRCQEARRRVSKTVTLIRELRNQRDSARQQVQQLESKSAAYTCDKAKDEAMRKRLPDPVAPDGVVQAPKKPRTTSGSSSTLHTDHHGTQPLQSEISKTIPQLPDHKDMGKNHEDTPKGHDPVNGKETVSAEAVDRPKTTDSGLKFLSQKQGKLTILEVCLPHSLYEGSEQWPDEPFYFECNRVDNSSRFNIFLQVDPYKQSYDYKVQANDEETHQHFVIKPTRIHTRRCIWSRSNSQHKSKWQFVLTPNEHGKAPESTTGTSTTSSS